MSDEDNKDESAVAENTATDESGTAAADGGEQSEQQAASDTASDTDTDETEKTDEQVKDESAS